MKLFFKRSGGFAGLTAKVEVDSTTLPEDQAKELDTLVNTLLPFAESNPGKGFDMFSYELVLEDDQGKSQKLQVDDMSATDDMHNLFDFLLTLRKIQKN